MREETAAVAHGELKAAADLANPNQQRGSPEAI